MRLNLLFETWIRKRGSDSVLIIISSIHVAHRIFNFSPSITIIDRIVSSHSLQLLDITDAPPLVLLWVHHCLNIVNDNRAYNSARIVSVSL